MNWLQSIRHLPCIILGLGNLAFVYGVVKVLWLDRQADREYASQFDQSGKRIRPGLLEVLK